MFLRVLLLVVNYYRCGLMMDGKLFKKLMKGTFQESGQHLLG